MVDSTSSRYDSNTLNRLDSKPRTKKHQLVVGVVTWFLIPGLSCPLDKYTGLLGCPNNQMIVLSENCPQLEQRFLKLYNEKCLLQILRNGFSKISAGSPH